MTIRHFYVYLCCFSLWACAPNPPTRSPGHLEAEVINGDKKADTTPAPLPLANYLPPLPPPKPVAKLERYTVVVNLIDVKELLFALARDAALNVDIHPAIEGKVTINAVQQTLPQILARIVKQVDLRYELDGDNLIITPDNPYIDHYRIDYFNLDRSLDSNINVATQIATTGTSSVSDEGGGDAGGGNNNSLAQISNQSENKFWMHLERSLRAIINAGKREKNEDAVVINSTSGLVTVYGTAKQHKEVSQFIEMAVGEVKRQVLIEATIVEVQLSDKYQAGVDWKHLGSTMSSQQDLIKGRIATDNNNPSFLFNYVNPDSAIGNIAATVQLLESFGNIKVISSPKLMVLNNQPAILKVVNNEVYFTYSSSTTTNVTGNSDENVSIVAKSTTTVHTVPEGLVMTVIPHVSKNDRVVLNLRPTISRIIDYKDDPSPELQGNKIPVVQVREIESVLEIESGKVAIMGGLMEDFANQKNDGLPGLSRLPMVGDLFSYRDDQYTKTELVIFLRPTVIKRADIREDLREYQRYLPDSRYPNNAPNTGFNQP